MSDGRAPYADWVRQTSVWQKAPGVKLGMFGWAKSTKSLDQLAHAYRCGYGMKTASCGYTFLSAVELPHERDTMCSLCARRVREVEEMMAE